MKKKFLISTGGSGGHVIPAMILQEHFQTKFDVIITTDKRGQKYLDNKTVDLKIIDTPRFNNIFFLPVNLIQTIFLIFKSFFLLRKESIEKVFSTGGYMSLPIILAARLLNLEIYLIEPNQVIGRANKFFLRSCEKIFCYTKNIKNFSNKFKNKIIVINPLVKKYVYELKKSQEQNDKFTLLIVGGSQGANIFDGNLKDLIANISKIYPIKIIQQTNEKNISHLSEFYSKNNIENEIFSFERNFAKKINIADLCITRSGASTLAELSVSNIPFIAIPLPTSKDDHQLENANFYKNNGCCWIVEQKHFEEKIGELIKEILNNKNDYYKKKENLKKLNYQNTWINVNEKILENINEN